MKMYGMRTPNRTASMLGVITLCGCTSSVATLVEDLPADAGVMDPGIVTETGNDAKEQVGPRLDQLPLEELSVPVAPAIPLVLPGGAPHPDCWYEGTCEDLPTPYVTGTLTCEVKDHFGTTTSNPLPFVRLKLQNKVAYTDANGNFSVEFLNASPATPLRVDYTGNVSGSGMSFPFEIVDELNNARGHDVNIAINGNLALGTLKVSEHDCELWRVGVLALQDYFANVGSTPNTGKLSILRWSEIYSDLTAPHTYYTQVKVATDFIEWKSEKNRRGTIFHEFAHTVRHKEDGGQTHWDGDNISWVYARSHDGTGLTNKPYAFNEGWATFWQNRTVGVDLTVPAATPANQYREFIENHVASYLTSLSAAASPKLMVRALHRNPGIIHSLWDFELAYCQLVPLPNDFCTNGRLPKRGKPDICPPNYDVLPGSCYNEPDTVAKYVGGLTSTVRTFSSSGQVYAYETDRNLAVDVLPGSLLTVSMTGTGNADLYVNFGARPGTRADCSPLSPGSTEVCSIWVPSDQSRAFINVRGATAANYTLTVTATQVQNFATAYSDSVAGEQLDAGQWRNYLPIRVKAGTKFKASLSGTGDADLYVRFGAAPTFATYDCRPNTSTANETCDLTVPANANLAYVSVKGATASTYTLQVVQ